HRDPARDVGAAVPPAAERGAGGGGRAVRGSGVARNRPFDPPGPRHRVPRGVARRGRRAPAPPRADRVARGGRAGRRGAGAGARRLRAGEPPLPDLALLAGAPAVGPRARRAVVDLLATPDAEVAWADPSLRAEAAVRQLQEGQLEAAPEVVRELRSMALDDG